MCPPPELVLGLEIVIVFLPVKNSAVFELKDDAAANNQAFTLALCSVLMNADDTTIITLKHLKQSGFESPSFLPAIPAELR